MMGFTLVIGKLAFGAYADRYGGRKATLCFGLLIFAGYWLFSLKCGSTPLAFIAMFLLGLGLSTGTVGVNLLATSFSDETHFVTTYKRFQILMMIGGVISGMIPGAIADLTGSYLPAITLATVLAAIYVIFVFFAYKSPKSEEP